MDQDLVISCSVKVFKICPHGHRNQIGTHSRLTINYVNGRPPSLVVYDASRQELLRILNETDVTRYTVLTPLKHEISRHNDSTIILEFYKKDAGDVRAFQDVMENVFRGLSRFSSNAEVANSSSSESDDDGEINGASQAAAAANATTMSVSQRDANVTYWDCAHCNFASSDKHSWKCSECGEPRVVNRDLEWQCRPNCNRVYSIGILECSSCRVWRCHKCTLLNKPSLHRCSACETYRQP